MSEDARTDRDYSRTLDAGPKIDLSAEATRLERQLRRSWLLPLIGWAQYVAGTVLLTQIMFMKDLVWLMAVSALVLFILVVMGLGALIRDILGVRRLGVSAHWLRLIGGLIANLPMFLFLAFCVTAIVSAIKMLFRLSQLSSDSSSAASR